MSTVDETLRILDRFNLNASKLLRICKKFEPDNVDIEWLQKTFSLTKDIDPSLLIEKSKDTIWKYRDHIVNRDTNFFLTNTYEDLIDDSSHKEFLVTLLDVIKSRVKTLKPQELDHIWALIKGLLTSVIEYKKITGDHS